jgi:hypothetical protein
MVLWYSSLALVGPRRILEHSLVAIEVLECLPLYFPIEIIRGDTLKPGCEQPGTTSFPFRLAGM